MTRQSIHFLEMLSQSLSLDFVERHGAPWTGHQPIAHINKEPSTITFSTMDSLESSINLACMFLQFGRKPSYLAKTHTTMEKTCRVYTGWPEDLWSENSHLHIVFSSKVLQKMNCALVKWNHSSC